MTFSWIASVAYKYNECMQMYYEDMNITYKFESGHSYLFSERSIKNLVLLP